MNRIVLTLAMMGGMPFVAAQTISYTNVTAVQQLSHDYGYTRMPGTFNVGGGVSFCDYDQDGLDDICFSTDWGQPVYCYKNSGTAFTDATPAPLLDDTLESKHMLWADYDNDGDRDLLLTNYLGPLHLYRNDGGTLVDVTAGCGLTLDTLPAFGASCGDYDLDGDLDLYICNYNATPDGINLLYNNDGNGAFTDVTTLAGVADSGKASFQATFFDYDNDGLPDLYVANDRFGPNTLYRNTGSGTFEDVSQSSGADLAMWSMCVAIGDFDNNGCMDIYITNVLHGNRLLVNQCNGTFVERAASHGLEMHKVCWGAQFYDADNDGDLDLYACASEDSATQWASNSFFENQNNTTFIERSGLGLDAALSSVGLAIGDHNADGFYDLVVSNGFGSGSRLYEATPNSNHWLKVTPQGVQSNRDGIGVTYRVINPGMDYMRYTTCGTNYAGQNSFSEILGLGLKTGLDQLLVTWPTGWTDTLKGIPADQHIAVIEGQSNIQPNASIQATCSEVKSGSIALAPSGGNGTFTYDWSNGDTTAALTGLGAGTYSVTITSNYSCRIFSFQVNPFPPVPTPIITQSGDTLSSSPATAYQWFLNGLPIAGALQQSHISLVNGQYHVQVTDSNGCSANSDTLSILLSNAQALPEAVEVLQNAHAGRYQLRLPPAGPEPLRMRVYALDGKLLHAATLPSSGQASRHELDLHNLPAAIYILQIQGGPYQVSKKLIRL